MFNATEFLGSSIGSSGITWYDVLLLVAILALFTLIAQLITNRLRKSLEDKLPKNDLGILLKIIYFGIIGLGLVIGLPNIDLSGILLAGGIAGIVIGFASQSVVSNFISGLFLIVERPIKIGDNISVGDVIGSVEDIRILSTIVRTYDGIYVRLPNEQVFTSNITNYVANAARRFGYVVGIRYEDDADKAVSIIKKVIWEHPFALKNPGPSVFVDELGDNGVNIIIKIWAPSRVWWSVKTEMLWKIKVALEAEGIEIPFPQRTVWFPDGIRMQAGPSDEDSS
ncbi:MAG: mechanosensitive ion channel family protein [Methanomicrobiales archaeon]|nr:mechanosensitive ion channel family protein [Methanomicrobiales archaeon]